MSDLPSPQNWRVRWGKLFRRIFPAASSAEPTQPVPVLTPVSNPASSLDLPADQHPPPAHVSGWTYCPLCASRLETREVCERARLACSAVGCPYVHWDSPKPVALCLVEIDGALVLTRRRHPPRIGTWCIPGGFVEAHEPPALAAKREVWEETGLLVELPTLLGVYSPCQGGNEVVIVFFAKPIGGGLNKGEEVLELGVFKEAQLPSDIGFPQHLEIIQNWFHKPERTQSR